MNARQVVTKFCKDNNITLGNGSQLYSPKEWRDRGEAYGCASKLIIVYDGGEMGHYIDPNYGSYALMEKFCDYLAEHGYWVEPCTGWYAAIYKE